LGLRFRRAAGRWRDDRSGSAAGTSASAAGGQSHHCRETCGDLIDRHETASAEARRRVMLTETRNMDLREALHTVCYWLAFALVRKGEGVDAVARKVREARVSARHAASAEGRELTDEDESGFVQDFPRYRVSGKRLARRARRFPPESAGM